MALKQLAWVGGAAGLMGLAAFVLYAWRTKDAALGTGWSAMGATALLLVLLWLWTDRQRLAALARSRAAKQSGFAGLLIAIAAGIAVGANVLATKHDIRWDLTSAKRYALSEQTISVAQGLTQTVELLTFFSGPSPDLLSFKDLLDGVSQHTDQLVISHHDPLLSPRLAEQYAITGGAGTVVLKSGDAEQRLEGELDEQALVNALIRLSSPVVHQICLASGHGEMAPDGPRLSGVVTLLERQNYRFTTANLMTSSGVPSECAVLIIADPEDDWLAPELEMLAAHIAGGGQVIVLLNPERAHGLASDMSRYGIVLGRDIVLEANPALRIMNGDASFLVLPAQSMADHPITTPIRSMVVMRMVRSVGQAQTVPEGIRTQELIHTSEYAWAETDLDNPAPPSPDPQTERIGKIPVATIAEITQPELLAIGPRTLASEGGTEPAIPREAGGRILVFGDADFTANELLGMGSNLDLLQNAIAWMVGEADQVSIRPNEAAKSTLVMDQIQALLLWLITVLVLPGICVSAAIGTWLARRRR
jgi:hypothetical protein